tara:strand:+ start:2701 stop:3003 length:303 start_codon:yes stop_codon:yes gene_type:complete
MTKYQKLIHNPPQLDDQVTSTPREVIFKTVSAMCDNVHYLKLRKNTEGDFRLNGNGFAISNWQMDFEQHDIEWEADANRWDNVIAMINTGTSKVESIQSR